MRMLTAGVAAVVAAALFLNVGIAQPPGERERGPGERGRPPEGRDFPRPPNPLMTALDTNRDGVLSPDEIRSAAAALKKLDRNGDGRLTQEELRPEGGPRRGPGPEGRPPMGREGRPPEGREGPPPMGREGRPPEGGRPMGGREGRPEGFQRGPGRGGPGGMLVPPFLREQLKLTEDQQNAIQKLEQETREKLMNILTPEQRRQMQELRERGFGGRERPGRPGGPEGRPMGPEGPGRPRGPEDRERPRGEAPPPPPRDGE